MSFCWARLISNPLGVTHEGHALRSHTQAGSTSFDDDETLSHLCHQHLLLRLDLLLLPRGHLLQLGERELHPLVPHLNNTQTEMSTR